MSSIASPALTRAELRVVSSTPADRGAVYDILLNSNIFHQADAETVDQMFNEAFSKPSDDNYQFLSCWNGTEMVGFACYGRESMTQGTWDIFWACVSSSARRIGAGKALFNEVLRRARQEGVRLVVLYTSSTEIYAPARALYDSLKLERTAVVPDYYATGDDLYIYTKRMGCEE